MMKVSVIVVSIVISLVYAQVSFFDFGNFTSDTKMEICDDCIETLNFPDDLTFFQKTHSFVEIDTNGVIWVGIGQGSDYVSGFGVDATYPDDELIAPFWADINIEDGGEIYYRASEEEGDLIIADTIIQSFTDQGSFASDWVTIITYANVSAYDGDGISYNSFQTLIIKGADASFVMFLYGNIEWFINDPHSGIQNSSTLYVEINSYNVSTCSNLGDPAAYGGQYLWRVDEATAEEYNSVECTTTAGALGDPHITSVWGCKFEADKELTRATLMECENDKLDIEYNEDWDYHIYRVRTVINGKHDKYHWKALVHPQRKMICGNLVEFKRYILGINLRVLQINNRNFGGLFNESSCVVDTSKAKFHLPKSHD